MLDQASRTLKVKKPWGEFEQYTLNQQSTVKILTTAPGGTLSSQYHFKRDELWIVLDDGAQVVLDNEVLHPGPQEKIFIPRRTIHRLSAVGNSRYEFWKFRSESSTRRT